jgi:diaminopimelate decarboxylase
MKSGNGAGVKAGIPKRVNARWMDLLLKSLKCREKRLPKGMLERYLLGKMSRRETLLQSAEKFGTPQYFFDEPALTTQVERFNRVFSRHLTRYRGFYAVKSNTFPGVCKRVVEAGMGLDVSSGFELSMALFTGCGKILFTGPAKTDEELTLAIQNRSKVTILLDSHSELQRLSVLMKRGGKKRYPTPLKMGIRVRPKQESLWNKFGVPLRELSGFMKKAMEVKGVEPCGIQFHTSWNLGPEAQVSMIREIGSHIHLRVPRDLWKTLKFIDIGGGYWPEEGEWLNPQNTFKGQLLSLVDPASLIRRKRYFKEAKPIDHFAREIAEELARQGSPMKDLEVWTEPGRWISTPSMHVLLRVVDKKNSRTAITDGGTNLLGWERPLAEFIPVINLTHPSLREHPSRVFGSLCTPHDVWGTSIFGEGIEEGDVLLIPDQGAYTYSLRQSFIKPRARVIRYDGKLLEEAAAEEKAPLI